MNSLNLTITLELTLYSRQVLQSMLGLTILFQLE